VWTPPGLRQLLLLRSLHVRTQHAACRNAMLASTAMAERRRERLEVEEFLRSLDMAASDVPQKVAPAR
jgi:hypothetical protein